MSDIVPELRRLWRAGGVPLLANWQERNTKEMGTSTYAHMTPEYLAKLPGGNDGVVFTGEKSGGLIAIDIDNDPRSLGHFSPGIRAT